MQVFILNCFLSKEPNFSKTFLNILGFCLCHVTWSLLHIRWFDASNHILLLMLIVFFFWSTDRQTDRQTDMKPQTSPMTWSMHSSWVTNYQLYVIVVVRRLVFWWTTFNSCAFNSRRCLSRWAEKTWVVSVCYLSYFIVVWPRSVVVNALDSPL